MNEVKKKKLHIFPLTVIIDVLVAGLSIFLIVYELESYENSFLDITATQQDTYVGMVLDNIQKRGIDSDDVNIENVLDYTEASDNQYWALTRGKIVLFLKDKDTTDMYKSFSPETYFKTESAREFYDSLEINRIIHRVIVIEGDKVIASGVNFVYGGETYSLFLLSNASAFFNNSTFIRTKTAIVLVNVAALLVFVLLSAYLSYRLQKSNMHLNDVREENNIMLGKLENMSNHVINIDAIEKTPDTAEVSEPADTMEAEIEEKPTDSAEADAEEEKSTDPAEAEEEKSSDTTNDSDENEKLPDASEKIENIVLTRQYRIKFYLNMHHYIIINGEKGAVHPHTWEFCLVIKQLSSHFVEFTAFEEGISKYLEKYQDKLLNEIDPFDTIIPTLEHVTDYFSGEFSKLIAETGGILLRVESSETPTRTYVIDLA